MPIFMPGVDVEDEAEVLPHPDKIKALIIKIDSMIDDIFFILNDLLNFSQICLHKIKSLHKFLL